MRSKASQSLKQDEKPNKESSPIACATKLGRRDLIIYILRFRFEMVLAVPLKTREPGLRARKVVKGKRTSRRVRSGLTPGRPDSWAGFLAIAGTITPQYRIDAG